LTLPLQINLLLNWDTPTKGAVAIFICIMPANSTRFIEAPASQTVVPPPGHIRTGTVTAIPRVLQQFGHDPKPLLRRVGLSLKSLSNPDTIVSLATIGRLLALCAEVSDCPWFGLLVGRQVPASALGVLGYTIQNASDVDTALSNLIRYRGLNDRGAFITLERDGPLARLKYSIIDLDVTGADQIYDCAIAIGCNILRGLCGDNWSPTEVMLSHARPGDRTPFDKFFRCPVRFGAVYSCLVFNRRWLEKAPPGADPMLYSQTLREARQLHHSEPADTDEILILLRTLLRGGLCKEEDVAALLGISRRTLGRKLLSAGTTFRREVEAMRFAQAKHLLADATLNTKQVAFTLSYADVSAFSHAFKRWSGMSPGQWRKSHELHPA
jgi:AraC-like DNA-binding protein